MKRKNVALVVAVSLGLTACGVEMGGVQLPIDPDAPLVQVRSEGGFAPVE